MSIMILLNTETDNWMKILSLEALKLRQELKDKNLQYSEIYKLL